MLAATFALIIALITPNARAHDIDDGLELGASLVLKANDPVEGTLILVPKVNFKSAIVELPNASGGAQIACRLGAMVQNQRYSCAVAGSVPDTDSGLVIAISGIRATSIPGHDDLVYKAFTVPNPKFDAAAQAKKTAALAKGATLQSTTNRKNQ